jgi:truncated hemoglobin YjbI
LLDFPATFRQRTKFQLRKTSKPVRQNISLADPSPIYDALGGAAGCHALSAGFYARVARDPVLRPFFPGKSMKCAIDAFAAFLVDFLGGAPGGPKHRWHLSLDEVHRHFRIGVRERDAWLRLMHAAIDETALSTSDRQTLTALFDHASAYLVNHGPAPAAPAIHDGDLAGRWTAQHALERAIAAICAEDCSAAIGLADGIQSNRAGLLAIMLATRKPALLDYVRAAVHADPALIDDRTYGGRTLLHDAAAAGDPDSVTLLLELGADPNARDRGDHTPLYTLANECLLADAVPIVPALVRAGADVNAADGVTRATPLHMAARRGAVAIAAALLEAGADLDIRDRRGDTPLRRAQNCRRHAVADLLRSRGATL